MKIIASIQARMGSERLPGKVLARVAGRELLEWQINRLEHSALVDEVVVATTTSVKDDVLADWCEAKGTAYFRGPENDVLSRVAQVLEFFGADIHVECFGDSPLIDPMLVDQFLGILLKEQQYHCVTSTLKTTYPPGLEVMAYWSEALLIINSLITSNDPLREHGGFNLSRFPEVVSVLNVEAPVEHCEPDVFLEVDTKSDLEVMEVVLSQFQATNGAFGIGQILDFVRENPAVFEANKYVDRRWKSLRTDD